jgi:enamine deaminase RidA (YjgF/YER057c/UK114 family)
LTRATARERLAAAGLALPAVARPTSLYVPVRVFAGVAYCAGVTSDGHVGVVGATAGMPEALAAARSAALRQLAYLEAEIGSLDGGIRLLRLTGFVCCISGFADTPAVIDAASQMYLTALGDADGAHARSAIGVAGLPGGALVELEATFGLSQPAREQTP